MGSAAALKASALCRNLRDEGFIALTDITGRGLKAQMKYADKVGAAFTVVLGDDELENGKAKIKNMKTGEQCEFSLDAICDTVYKLKENNILDGIFDAKI